MDNYLKLDQYKEPYTYFFDAKLQNTYFISRVETHINMVLIYTDKKKHNDPSIWEFVHAMLKALRNEDIFLMMMMMKEPNK